MFLGCLTILTPLAPAAAAEEPASGEGASGAVIAAESPAAIADVLARLRQRQWVRVASGDDRTTEGRFVALDEKMLLLDRVAVPAQRRLGSDRATTGVPTGSVRAIWTRGRGTKTGALVGGAVGVLAGLALGTLGQAMCETDACRAQWPEDLADPAVALGAAGVIAGGLVGSQIARWDPLYPAENGQGRDGPGARLVPSSSLHLGWNEALGDIPPSGGLDWRLSMGLGRGVVVPSLELGRHKLGSRSYHVTEGRNDYVTSYDESLMHVGPAVTVGPSRGAVRPYAVAGLGYYRWIAFDATNPPATRSEHLLGGSVGGGVRVQAAKKLALSLEGRWHTNLSPVSAGGRPLSLATVNGGVTYAW